MPYSRDSENDLIYNRKTGSYTSSTYIDCNSVSLATNNLFADNANITSVDLQNIPFVNNQSYRTFYNCTGLTSVTNINDNTTELQATFSYCTSLVNPPVLPSHIQKLDSTFYYCNKLETAPIIPNTVTNMHDTFNMCSKLTTPPTIPNSVTNLDFTFANAGIETAPVIPNTITSLSFTFGGTKITTPPVIPDVVTNLQYTFYGCRNLLNPPVIPESVTNMQCSFQECNFDTAPVIPQNVINLNCTFYNCNNLVGDVYIYSDKVTNANGCFHITSDTPKTKYVYIPFKDANNNNTTTYNSFISAGYDANGTKDGVYLRELVKYTLTINPVPSDATVTFIGDGEVSADGKSITVLPNTSVTYTVSSDYDTISDTIVVTNNSTITVNALGLDWSNSIIERNFSSVNEIKDISIAYNGSKYISVLYTYSKWDEDCSYISTSTDDIMWTPLKSIDDYRDYIAYGNNKFVILDDYGQIMTSDDGEIWSSKTAVSNLGNNNWGHIVYGNNKFIALCYDTNGYISTSTDGTNWTLAEQNSTLINYTWSDLIYDGSKFIVLSTNGYISTSTDGTNWTTPIQDSNLNNYTWKSIVYDNSKYVMISYNGFVSVSTNCTNWTTPVRELPNLGNRNGWIHIDYNGNNYVAFSEYINYIIYTKSENTPDLTLTINPTPSDATVTFDSSGTVSGNSITVQYGSYVTYSVDKSGYKPIKKALARPTSIDTQIDVALINLGIWELVGTPNRTMSKNYRYDFKYSSYYNKYYTIVDNGYSTSNLIFTSDFLSYTSYDGHFGVLSSGQIVKITGTTNRDSSTGIYTKTINSQLLNSDLTWTTSTTIYSETASTSYVSLDVFNGYIINGSLCFPIENQISTKNYNNYFMYTSNGTNWSRYIFNSNSDTYILQLTPLGSNGSYATIVVTTSSGCQLHKFTSPTSKTAGNVLFTDLNMTGASGFYDGYSFNYTDYHGIYRSSSSYFTTNGTTKSMYQGRTYEDYVSIQQRYVSGNNVYINVKREDLTKLAVLSTNYNTKHTELTTPMRIRNILGLIDNYIYIYDEDGDVYRTNYIENILDLI